MRRSPAVLGSAVLMAALVQADCKSNGEPPNPPAPVVAFIPSEFDPVALPDPRVEGFVFPESAATVDGWAASGDEKAMARHAWGLFTAMMMDSGQSFEGEPLRVFETWFTIGDLDLAGPAGSRARRSPRPLGELAGLARARRAKKIGAAATVDTMAGIPPRPPGLDASAFSDAEIAVVKDGEDELLGSVKFSPEAADHIADDDLLSGARLTELLEVDKLAKVPDFPARSVVAKPVYRVVPIGSAANGGGVAPRYASVPYWSGPPDPPAASSPSQWTSCVWIDGLDRGPGTGTGAVDPVCAADGSSRAPESTYGLGRFLYFMVTAGELAADATLEQAETTRPSLGNAVILVAIHVSTRETRGWTWETFWWTPSADSPPSPSSSTFAAERPPELTGAARSYAGCSVLSMQKPPEPLTGGTGGGESVYCYNPWLEAQFGPKILSDSRPGTFDGKAVPNDVGVQSNCMSCHAQAAYSPSNELGYTGDRYVDLAGPAFATMLQTDFMWSVTEAAR